MRSLYHPDQKDIVLTNVLYALSDPVRLRIVWSLASNTEASCGAFGFSIPKPSLSYHFKVLREAGVTRTRLEKTRRFVSLRYQDLEARFPGLLDIILACVDVHTDGLSIQEGNEPHVSEKEHVCEDTCESVEMQETLQQVGHTIVE